MEPENFYHLEENLLYLYIGHLHITHEKSEAPEKEATC